MALAKRFLSSHEERAKKHDDNWTSRDGDSSPLSRAWRGPRRKRIAFGLVALGLLYIFFKNMPTDLPPVRQRVDTRYGPLGPEAVHSESLYSDAAPVASVMRATQFYFDGPVAYPHLASTLRRGGATDHQDRHVLFAFSSLKSASNLIPLACEMAQQGQNSVHVAFMGRDEGTIDKIREVNGIVVEDCPAQWHDARPDFSSISTDKRMKVSVRASLAHLRTFLRTNLVVVDQAQENAFFLAAVEERVAELDLTLIRIPANGFQALRWMTRLEGASLRHWGKVQIDILVHNTAESSASLMRLMRSLQSADYFGHVVPRIAVDLPSTVDPPTLLYLSNFQWPPLSSPAESRLSIRRRTNPAWLSSTEASLHTIESFYPTRASASHVLVLTPDAELSPMYFHYLMYTILEYKYSSTKSAVAKNLLGVSLDLPEIMLNGSTAFRAPSNGISTPLFLWQAPNSNAALYFGDKWTELHTFLSRRFTVDPKAAKSLGHGQLVSAKYPSWMQYMLEFIRARGYLMLYPAFAEQTGSSMVTIHRELYEPPEEVGLAPADTAETEVSAPSIDTILAAETDKAAPEIPEHTVSNTGSILNLLSFGVSEQDGDESGLPNARDLPVLAFSGESLTLSGMVAESSAFADDFSLKHGSCETLNHRTPATEGSVEHLFCSPPLNPVDPASDVG